MWSVWFICWGEILYVFVNIWYHWTVVKREVWSEGLKEDCLCEKGSKNYKIEECVDCGYRDVSVYAKKFFIFVIYLLVLFSLVHFVSMTIWIVNRCDLFLLIYAHTYFSLQGMDEDKGPQSRKLYGEVIKWYILMDL